MARASYLLERRIRETGRSKIEALYRDSDIIISAPGGFLHDHYEINGRLDSLEFAADLGKPVMIFAQSIGPFWKPHSRIRVKQVFEKLSAICVRDQASADAIRECNINDRHLRVTGDAAFLLADDLATLTRSIERKPGRVGLCFRAWPHSTRATLDDTVANARQLCQHLLSGSARELYFVSTCQGVPGYVDDSEVAARIVDSLDPGLQSRCVLDRRRHSTNELVSLLATCQSFVGMRLHGCLLSMMVGTPAFGLGYEPKTPEIFTQMGLQQYQVSFDAPYEEWLPRVEQFISDVPRLTVELPGKLRDRKQAAELTLDVLGGLIPRNP